MNISLVRQHSTDFCVLGVFIVDGLTLYSMELPLLYEGQSNVRCKTCIPANTYLVKNMFSEKHGRLMPHVMSVPDRDDIEIHAASRPRDILGCIAVAGDIYNAHPESADDVVVNESQLAFSKFQSDFESALANNETVVLTITEELSVSA